MPNGGALTIEGRNVVLPPDRDSPAGDYVFISVTDTGEGMDDETRARAFEPFFTTKAPGMGTGLGLAMCHGIVNQHGGLIRVFSELNRGTQISVLLPRVVGSADSAPKSDLLQPPKGGNETVLLLGLRVVKQ